LRARCSGVSFWELSFGVMIFSPVVLHDGDGVQPALRADNPLILG
jgi:hypothetical protein